MKFFNDLRHPKRRRVEITPDEEVSILDTMMTNPNWAVD
jgi:hypothetical protein